MYKKYTLYTHRRKTMCKANDIPSTEQNNSVTAMRNWLIEYGPIFFFSTGVSIQ